MIRFITSCFTLFGISTIVYAEDYHAIRPLPGFICMQFALSPNQVGNPNVSVPVRDTPSMSSHVSSLAPSVIVAPVPQQPTDGFFRILLPDGQGGWVPATAVRPWKSPTNPNRRCIPSVMSNGRVGFDFQQ